MIIFKESESIYSYLTQQMNEGMQIGFVPTMGALHPGHLSLIQKSLSENSLTVCSIFVNPKQFNQPQDFSSYPVTLEKDIEMLENAGCSILFLPTYTQIYPDDYIERYYPLDYLETILEGKYRPGHYQGVCQVVDRLLQICLCHTIYLGQKDYQQCLVIKKMIEFINSPVMVKTCETKREADGLAMSSRNMRLSSDQRKKAPILFKSLTYITQNAGQSHALSLLEAKKQIESAGFILDYLTICDPSLRELSVVENQFEQEPESIQSVDKKIVLVAASLGDIRLIDNCTFK